MALPNTLVLTGQRFNYLEWALSVAASSADANLGVSRLYDGVPAQAFKAASAVTDLVVTADLALFQGNMTTWGGGLPSGFTKSGPGTLTEVSPGRGGAGSAASIQVGASETLLVRDFQFRAGAKLYLDAYAQRNSGTPTGVIRLYDRDANLFLNADGVTWQAGATDLVTTTAAAYANLTKAITLRSYQAARADWINLRLLCLATGGGGATDSVLFDDVFLYPAVDFLSLHGHNIPPSIVVTMRSSTDNFSGVDTAEATLTVAEPTFYTRLAAPVNRRFWRIKYAGTPVNAIYTGEAVLGLAYALARGPVHPAQQAHELPVTFDQLRVAGGSGHEAVYARSPHGHREGLRIPFQSGSQVEYDDFRENVVLRSACGANQMVLVPADNEAMVIHGRVAAPRVPFRRTLDNPTRTEHVLAINENPFPLVGT